VLHATAEHIFASCVASYDNLGFIVGTLSNIFIELCSGSLRSTTNPVLNYIASAFPDP
jgi:hypothetical protein